MSPHVLIYLIKEFSKSDKLYKSDSFNNIGTRMWDDIEITETLDLYFWHENVKI